MHSRTEKSKDEITAKLQALGQQTDDAKRQEAHHRDKISSEVWIHPDDEPPLIDMIDC